MKALKVMFVRHEFMINFGLNIRFKLFITSFFLPLAIESFSSPELLEMFKKLQRNLKKLHHVLGESVCEKRRSKIEPGEFKRSASVRSCAPFPRIKLAGEADIPTSTWAKT